MPPGRGSFRLRGQTSIAPRMPTGTIGTPALRAASSAPPRNSPSRPSRERVPSGKIVTQSPASRWSVISRRALRSAAPRLTSTAPHSRITKASQRASARLSRATKATCRFVEAALRRRDELDSTRADSPLVRADDAELVETDGATAEQVVDRLL
ncbi:MAG: (d)CMP kinase, partial [Planctomycetes bacterium]|nr:(d)CMP kinase [Planctomycetota bacterium]